jgi:hypothetical protein
MTYIEEDSQKALKNTQDLLDKARDVALTRATVYQQSLQNYHSRRVLCLKQTSTKKLEPPCEGPHFIKEVIPVGAYRLYDIKSGADKKDLWNAAHL